MLEAAARGGEQSATARGRQGQHNDTTKNLAVNRKARCAVIEQRAKVCAGLGRYPLLRRAMAKGKAASGGKRKAPVEAPVAQPVGKRKGIASPPVPEVPEALVRYAPCISASVMVNPLLIKRFAREEVAAAEAAARGCKAGSSNGKHEHELEDATRWVTKTGMATYLTLRTRSMDGGEIFFKCRPTTMLEKLMDAYCFRANIDPHTVAFFKADEAGQPELQLAGAQTPQEVGLDDGDTIRVITVNNAWW